MSTMTSQSLPLEAGAVVLPRTRLADDLRRIRRRLGVVIGDRVPGATWGAENAWGSGGHAPAMRRRSHLLRWEDLDGEGADGSD